MSLWPDTTDRDVAKIIAEVYLANALADHDPMKRWDPVLLVNRGQAPDGWAEFYRYAGDRKVLEFDL